MTKVQFIKGGDGKEMAVIPREEYDRLVASAAEGLENSGTRRLVRHARHAIAEGYETLIPKKIADRIAKGENAIKVLREWRDKTQMYMTFKTDLSQGYLSDLETGRRQGSADALAKIARVLNVPIDLLVS